MQKELVQYNPYIAWLMDIVQERNTQRALELMSKVYRYHLVLDENRAVAGKTLRRIYSDEEGISVEDIQKGPATVFEVIVALSQRFAENADILVPNAYYEIITNLGLTFSDDISPIDRWMDGEFSASGTGSPFPLIDYDGDVRSLDLWTQMTIYISQRYPLRSDWLKQP